MSYKLDVLVTGETLEDLGYALEEVQKAVVDDGCNTGFNSNDTGSYRFDLVEEGS